MQVVIKPGMQFMGVQGTPDRLVLRLNQKERATLRRAADIAAKARQVLADGDDDGYYGSAGEFASLAMWANELADTDEFTL